MIMVAPPHSHSKPHGRCVGHSIVMEIVMESSPRLIMSHEVSVGSAIMRLVLHGSWKEIALQSFMDCRVVDSDQQYRGRLSQ